MRNWIGTSTVGSWFSPLSGGDLPSSEEACSACPLPAGNLGVEVTLHLLRPGTILVAGACTDVTRQQDHGP